MNGWQIKILVWTEMGRMILRLGAGLYAVQTEDGCRNIAYCSAECYRYLASYVTVSYVYKVSASKFTKRLSCTDLTHAQHRNCHWQVQKDAQMCKMLCFS